MNLWVAVAIVVLAVAGAVGLLLLARRLAPPGGLLSPSAHAGPIFGVLGNSTAVVLAFVVLVALQSYGNARERAGAEAVAVTSLELTAQLLPAPTGERLRRELACYARAVIGDEWRTMRDRRTSPVVEGWLARLQDGIGAVRPRDGREAEAYARWFVHDAERREGRRGRLAEAAPVVPLPLWLLLALGATLVVGHALLFADRRQPVLAQAASIGTLTAVLAAGLLVVSFLDRPYEDRTGSIRPTEMARTLELMGAVATDAPCDERGRPTLG